MVEIAGGNRRGGWKRLLQMVKFSLRLDHVYILYQLNFTCSEGVAAAQFLSQASGKVYFEVEVCEAVGWLEVGFAGTNFQEDWVGMGEVSWGILSNGWTVHR